MQYVAEGRRGGEGEWARIFAKGGGRRAKYHAEHPKPPKPPNLGPFGKKHVMLTYNGETHTQGEWAKILGVKVVTISARRRRGWPIEKVLEPTHGPHDPRPRNLQR